MFIKKVVIENVRGFGSGNRKVELSLERPSGTPAGWTVFAGRNGAGKSSFLRAVALCIGGPGAARSLQQSYAGWIHSGRAEGKAAVNMEFDPVVDQFEAGGRVKADRTIWSGVRWEASATGSEPKVLPYVDLNKTGKQSPSRGPWAENPQGFFCAAYGPFRRLSGHAPDAVFLMRGASRVRNLVNLFREDASLVESVEWLKNLQLRTLEDRPGARELKESVIKLLNDGLMPDEMQVESVSSDGLVVTQKGIVLTLNEVSDGYRTMAALVVDLARQLFEAFGALAIQETDGHVQVMHQGVVLVDEIDVHLHVSWQQQIGFWLKSHFPNIQFLVTTHSPFICQAADVNGLFRLPAPGEDSPARPVTGNMFWTIVNGSADEAALTELFGLERVHSAASEELRRKVAELDVKTIHGRATERDRRELKQLELQLPQTADGVIDRSCRKFED